MLISNESALNTPKNKRTFNEAHALKIDVGL